MSSKSKFFDFGRKRKSAAAELTSANNSSTPSLTGAPQLPLPGQPMRPSTLQHQPNSSQSSVATTNTMNQPGAPQQRPPSYTGYPPGVPGRQSTTSPPMGPPQNPRTPPSQFPGGPPPINTAGGGYPPQQMGPPPPQMGGPPGGPPQYQGAPGYPGQPPQNMQQPYQTGRPVAEVEGTGRSKSQLIVGIDFVSSASFEPRLANH